MHAVPGPRRVSRARLRVRALVVRDPRRVQGGQGSSGHDGSGRAPPGRRRPPRSGRRRPSRVIRTTPDPCRARTLVSALRHPARSGLHLFRPRRRPRGARPRRDLSRVRLGKRATRLVWRLGLWHRARLRWRVLPCLPDRPRTCHRLHGTLRRQCRARTRSSPLTSSALLGGRPPHIMRDFDARLAHSTPSNAVRIVLDRTSHFREKRTNAYLQARRQDHPLRTG